MNSLCLHPVYRVIIAGCRDFTDYEYVRQRCDHLLSAKRKTHNIVIVSGGARGADALGERYAVEHGYILRCYPASWSKGGKAAGPIRNARMADDGDALIAFWDGKSRGTKNMIDIANARGLTVYVNRI